MTEANSDDEEVIMYYSITGGISLFTAGSLFVMYLVSKRLRIHPNRIIMHLLFSQIIFSACFLLNGIIVNVYKDQLETATGSFFMLSDRCIVEGTIKSFFNISFLLWNFAWVYDLYKSFKRPMHTTDQYMGTYSCIVYSFSTLISTIFLIIDLFFHNSIYNKGPCLTCSIGDKLFKYLIPSIEFIYVIIAYCVIYKYGRQSVIGQFTRSRSKLSAFFQIQKYYIITFTFLTLSRVLGFFVDTLSSIKSVYALIISASPCIVVIPLFLQSFLMLCYRRKILPSSKEALLGKDESQIISSIRNEILEYLIKGISQAIMTSSALNKKSIYIDDEEDFLERAAKFLCGCCYQSERDQIHISSITKSQQNDLFLPNLLEDKQKIDREAATQLAFQCCY